MLLAMLLLLQQLGLTDRYVLYLSVCFSHTWNILDTDVARAGGAACGAGPPRQLHLYRVLQVWKVKAEFFLYSVDILRA